MVLVADIKAEIKEPPRSNQALVRREWPRPLGWGDEVGAAHRRVEQRLAYVALWSQNIVLWCPDIALWYILISAMGVGRARKSAVPE
jgi:hypothetical protein